MKNSLNNKNKSFFLKLSLTSIVVVVAIVLILLAIFKFSFISAFFGKIFKILQPIIVGLFIAYIINPMNNLFTDLINKICNKLSKKGKDFSKFAKYIGITVSLTVFVFILFVLIYLIIPGFVKSISGFLNDLPKQMEKVNNWYENFMSVNDGWLKNFYATLPENLKNTFADKISINNVVKYLEDNLGTIISGLYSGVVNIVTFIINFVVGIIVAAYALSNKEKFKGQLKKIFFALFSKSKREFIIETCKKGNEIFTGFINGKLISALIIGIICFIGVTILGIPYPMLITVIITITDLIPIFGPYIGAIPCALLILISDPLKCLYFVIFIIVLQTLEGNVISPKIWGDSTGLSAFWVIFAILVGGGLFGFIGVLLGVPTFAVIYYIIKVLINRRVEKKIKQEQQAEGVLNEQEIAIESE